MYTYTCMYMFLNKPSPPPPLHTQLTPMFCRYDANAGDTCATSGNRCPETPDVHSLPEEIANSRAVYVRTHSLFITSQALRLLCDLQHKRLHVLKHIHTTYIVTYTHTHV